MFDPEINPVAFVLLFLLRLFLIGVVILVICHYLLKLEPYFQSFFDWIESSLDWIDSSFNGWILHLKGGV